MSEPFPVLTVRKQALSKSARPVTPVQKSATPLRREAVHKTADDFFNDPRVKALRAEGRRKNAEEERETQEMNARQAEAERFERLSKSVGDRELASYYAERAKEARSTIPVKAVKDTPVPIPQNGPKPFPATPMGNQPMRTDNPVVNATAKAGIVANAEAAERECREHERRAAEAERTARLSSARDVINNATARRQEHLAHAAMSRARGESFRRAAAAL